MIQEKRIGNFTSSEIAALLSMGTREMAEEEMREYKAANPKGRKKNIESWPGKAAVTYIEEKNFERRLGRSLDAEVNAKPLSWGKLVEAIPFQSMGLEYTLCSQETIVHPEYDYWSGSPDGVKENTVFDLKCPMTLKSFCTLVQPLYDGLSGEEAIEVVRENHKDGEKYYWQLVSNSVLTNSEYGELIVYMPYKHALDKIRKAADGQMNLYWLQFSQDNELPFLEEDGYYNDLNTIRFRIPESDKLLLEERVKSAGKMLVPRLSIITAHLDDNVGATIIQ